MVLELYLKIIVMLSLKITMRIAYWILNASIIMVINYLTGLQLQHFKIHRASTAIKMGSTLDLIFFQHNVLWYLDFWYKH